MAKVKINTEFKVYGMFGDNEPNIIDKENFLYFKSDNLIMKGDHIFTEREKMLLRAKILDIHKQDIILECEVSKQSTLNNRALSNRALSGLDLDTVNAPKLRLKPNVADNILHLRNIFTFESYSLCNENCLDYLPWEKSSLSYGNIGISRNADHFDKVSSLNSGKFTLKKIHSRTNWGLSYFTDNNIPNELFLGSLHKMSKRKGKVQAHLPLLIHEFTFSVQIVYKVIEVLHLLQKAIDAQLLVAGKTKSNIFLSMSRFPDLSLDEHLLMSSHPREWWGRPYKLLGPLRSYSGEMLTPKVDCIFRLKNDKTPKIVSWSHNSEMPIALDADSKYSIEILMEGFEPVLHDLTLCQSQSIVNDLRNVSV